MAYRSISTNNTQATSLVVTAPSGIQDGDILIAFGWSDDTGTTFGYPAGFAALTGTPLTTSFDGMRTGVALKIASSESGNYTITGSTGICGGVVCFSGRDASTTPHKSSTAVSNVSSGTITSAAYASNTTATCDICVIVGSDSSGVNITHSAGASGLTERADIQDTVSDFINGAVYTLDAVASGADGVYSITPSGNTGWSSISIALADAAGGGGGGASSGVTFYWRRRKAQQAA